MRILNTGSLLTLCILAACDHDAEKLARGECPALLPAWTTPSHGRSAFRVMNVVAFSNANITWNRQPVSRAKLREYLVIARSMEPGPFTIFDPSGAPDCAAAADLRDEINEAADCAGGGVCGQGTRRDWDNAPGLSGPGWVE